MALNAANISIIKRLLGGRNTRPLKSIILKIEPVDLAQVFTALNDREMRFFVETLLSLDKASYTIRELPPPQIQNILRNIEPAKTAALLNYSPEDHSAYFLEVLEEGEREAFLKLVDAPKYRRLSQLLSYPQGSAGRDMDTQVLCLSERVSAQEAIDQIRNRTVDSVYYIYCVDDQQRLVGITSLRELVTANANTPLSEIIKREIIKVSPETPVIEAAHLVKRYDFIAIPVVDSQNHLLGTIAVDDVIDLLQEQATEEIYKTAGLETEDRVYSAPVTSIKFRLPWIMVNLGTAFMASGVVSLFQATLEQFVILATLNNIVAGMGGNTAIQTMTVVTRGLATGDFSFTTLKKAVTKEILVGLALGLASGIAAGVLVYWWKGQVGVAVVLSMAMFVNSLVATTFGAMIPVTLKRFNLDPAAGSGVIVTALTDCIGFFSFLGIATVGLKFFNYH